MKVLSVMSCVACLGLSGCATPNYWVSSDPIPDYPPMSEGAAQAPAAPVRVSASLPAEPMPHARPDASVVPQNTRAPATVPKPIGYSAEILATALALNPTVEGIVEAYPTETGRAFATLMANDLSQSRHGERTNSGFSGLCQNPKSASGGEFLCTYSVERSPQPGAINVYTYQIRGYLSFNEQTAQKPKIFISKISRFER